jgi:HEAT repeat protein
MGLFKPNIKKMSDKGNAHGLIKCLNHNKDWRMRRAVAEGLQKLRDAKSLEPLIVALKDENEEVRKSVIAALTRTLAFGLFDRPSHRDIGGARSLIDVQLAFKVLTGMLEKSTHHKRAIALLVQGLKDVNENTRIGSAMVLGILRQEEAVPHLAKVLNDSNEQVRKEAAAALVKIERLKTQPNEYDWTTILMELGDMGCFDEKCVDNV